MQNFTTEELLLFIYNEMSNLRKKELEQELVHNWALREKLQVLKEAVQSLHKLKLEAPRPATIEAIMQYATHGRKTTVRDFTEYIWLKK